MITKAEAVDAVNFELVVTGENGVTYRLDDPLNGDSDTASPYVFDFQYTGTSQPTDMTAAVEQFSNWTPLATAERAKFEEMLTYVESIVNVDFQRVSGQADPTLNVGKVSLEGNTAGIGGFGYSVSILGNDVSLEDYDNFVVYDNSISIAAGQDNLVLHEILHALSMKHPFEGTPTLSDEFDNNKYTVLSYTNNPDNDRTSDGFQLFDIAAIQQRWGANMATGAGNDSYTGTRNTTVDTVWDAGGTDTFDASLRGTGVTLSLGQGTFSSFASRNDVAIAYDTVIENAIGGSGNDTITGNATANQLSGGSGNDVLLGSAGDDFLVGESLADASGTESGQVYRIYRATLDRAPDTSGFANWVDRLETGERTLSEVVTGFVASNEFQRVYGTLTDRAFVTLLYNNVLERAPDANGLNGWLQQLSNGTARENVVIGFSESNEFKLNTGLEASAYAGALTGRAQSEFLDDVFRLYGATLDRAPDAAGLDNWSGKLAEGDSYVSIAAGFTNSDEFVNAYGSLDDRGFVNQLYRNVLDREGDEAGVTNWLNLIEGAGSREDVVRGFAQSQEFVRNTSADFEAYVKASGGDTLNGGPGNDALYGSTAADTFVFTKKNGGAVDADTVLQLDAWDTLRFEGFGFDDAADALAGMRVSGNDVVFARDSNSITFTGATLDTLREVDYIFG